MADEPIDQRAIDFVEKWMPGHMESDRADAAKEIAEMLKGSTAPAHAESEPPAEPQTEAIDPKPPHTDTTDNG